MKTRLPVSVIWPIRDEYLCRWLVPGDWSRGRARAHVAKEERGEFVGFNVRRRWLRWSHLDFFSTGWRLEDGTLVDCQPDEKYAEPYWEVVRA